MQTFEVNHCSIKKSKGIALITTKSAEEDSDAKLDCDSDDADFEALFEKKLKRFLKNRVGQLLMWTQDERVDTQVS